MSPSQHERGWLGRAVASIHTVIAGPRKATRMNEWTVQVSLKAEGERKLAAFYSRKERGVLPGLAQNPFRECSDRKIKSRDPLKAPGKLRSDLELTVGWMFAQGGPQAWALGIISCLQHLIFHHSLALVAFKNPATVYAWKKN